MQPGVVATLVDCTSDNCAALGMVIFGHRKGQSIGATYERVMLEAE